MVSRPRSECIPWCFHCSGVSDLSSAEIGFADGAELLDGLAWIALVVMAGDDPGVLIKAGDGSSGRAEDETHAKSADDFSVCHVGEDVVDRPLIGRGALAKFAGGQAFDQALEFFWGGGLYCERILPST